MKAFRLAAMAALLLASSLSVSTFIFIWTQNRGFDILHHMPHLSWEAATLFFLLSLALVGGVYFAASVLLSNLARLLFSDAFIANKPLLLPCLFLSLSPLTLFHFLTRADLYSRFLLFAVVAGFSLLITELIIIREKRQERGQTAGVSSWLKKNSWSTKPLTLFLTALVLYGVGAFIIHRRGVTFSGDEPHYLLVTHSLLFDHDFDLTNNYEQRDYEALLGPGVVIQPHTVFPPGKDGRLSFHSPGVSFFLLPFYWAGFKLGGWAFPFLIRMGIAIWGALFGLQVFYHVKERGWGDQLALQVWAIFSFTVPVYFYSLHVYPEIIAAFFSLVIFRCLSRVSPQNSQLGLSGLLLSLLFWFHSLKYLFIIIPFLLFALVKIKKATGWLGKFVIFLAPFSVGTIAYFGFQKWLYGSFNPTAVSWQGAMSGRESLSFLQKIFFSIPFHFRWETLAGYFFDQRDGLLFYAPVYCLAFVGILMMLRQRPKQAWLLLFLTWPYFLVSAFLTQRTGYAPQARPLVASFWGFGVFLGYFLYANRRQILGVVARVAFFQSFLNMALLVFYPLNLYQETTAGTTERAGGFFYLWSNLYFSLPRYLPSFIKTEDNLWLPNFIWIGLFFLFLLLSLSRFDLKKMPSLGGKVAGLCVAQLLLFFWLILFPRLTLTRPVQRKWPQGQSVVFFSLSRVARVAEPGTFLLPQDGRAYHFWFFSKKKLSSIEVRLSYPGGIVSTRISMFDHLFFEGNVGPELDSWLITSPPVYRRGKDFLYWISIDLERVKKGNISKEPFLFTFILRNN